MKQHIRHLIRQALDQLTRQQLLPQGLEFNIQVENARDKSHGDFASNIAMMLAKPAGMKPRDLAQQIQHALPADEQISQVAIAGPGFLNFFQNHDALARRLDLALDDPRLGIAPVASAIKTVVDLSSPNLAKEMHVGHLRSTIIGDAVARVLEFQGHEVIRQNHVGDWGTQFGMLLAYLENNPDAQQSGLADLEEFYRAAKQCFDNDAGFAERARELVVQLQAGDAQCLRLWQSFNEVSLSHCQQVYDLLGVRLGMQDVRGESSYNADLPQIIEQLQQKNLLTRDQGAQCVFMQEFSNSEGEPLPLIVQKADGGYLYATTDLAAIRYRSQQLQARRLLYFVDQRQALHFQMVFAAARLAGFASQDTSMEHMGFGTMNGPDGRPFKTRDGGTVKLIDLLDEAVERAYQLVKEKNPELDEAELKKIARAVGIGAVKYADLSKHRASDYSFNFEQMLSFEGNTAPYLLYAYTRVASLLRRIDSSMDAQLPGQIRLQDAAEQDLAAALARYGEVLDNLADKGTPHILCTYLYELAGLFSSFYENCPILNAQQQLRDSRLRLAALTGRTLQNGLQLLGLQPLERM